MCGRAYATYTDEELAMKYLNKRPLRIPSLQPRYNLAPTQLTPVVFGDSKGNLAIEMFRWGLVPIWSKDINIGNKLINARGDTIDQKPSFRSSFKNKRCIVPVTGFFEWKHVGSQKRPFKIFSESFPLLSLAGIWDEWVSPQTGEIIRSFAIITTEPNVTMAPIHDRMPVILDDQQVTQWLNPKLENPKLLLAPCSDDILKAEEVSRLVNSPKNDTAENLVGINSN